MAGRLIVMSGPSGAGKTSLGRALVEQVEGLRFSVSHTTRRPRRGERHGVEYFFVSEPEFREMVARDRFLEHARVHGHYYGTSREWVTDCLDSGKDVLLDIDVQGARQIMDQVRDALTILILPPSRRELERRLTQRGQDRLAVIRRRMERAAKEVGAYNRYRYAIINDSLKDALLELKSVVGSHESDSGGPVRNTKRIQEVVETFKEAQ
ncbi:MAG: guanylate kinase [Candidatus Aminicenantes bacterium]|nr:guanylate kinase [Candidatus Aminicenantes bacterium]